MVSQLRQCFNTYHHVLEVSKNGKCRGYEAAVKGMSAIPCLCISGLMTGLGVKVLLKHLASSSCLKMTGILFLVLRIRSNIRLALVVMMDKVSFIAAGSEGKVIRLVAMTHKNRLHNWRVLTRQSRSAYHLD